MKEVVTDVLLILVGIVMAGLLVAFCVGKIRASMASGDKAYEKVAAQNEALDEYEYTQYDGAEIKGSEVINIIKKFEGEGQKICVKVNNGRTDTLYVYSEDLSKKLKSTVDDSSSKKKYNDKAALDTYINPSAVFLGSIVIDENTETIIRLEFTKVKND